MNRCMNCGGAIKGSEISLRVKSRMCFGIFYFCCIDCFMVYVTGAGEEEIKALVNEVPMNPRPES